LADGLDARILGRKGRIATTRLAAEGLLAREPLGAGRVVLTRRGRLLADAVVRDLVD
jgi:oxygen-independent coproporphyrinogen-3 oxidase